MCPRNRIKPILDLILKSTQCFGLEVTSLNTNELGKVLVSTQRSRPYLAVAYRGLSHGFRLLRGEEGKIRLKCPQVFLSIPKGSSLSCYSNQSWKNLPRKSFRQWFYEKFTGDLVVTNATALNM